MKNFPMLELFLTVLSSFGAGMAFMTQFAFGSGLIITILIIITILSTGYWSIRTGYLGTRPVERAPNYPSRWLVGGEER
jgi:hypothetical protein